MPSREVVPVLTLEKRIFILRGQAVLLDRDLAELYGVTTKAINQAVRRNVARFPPDFLYRLTAQEASGLSRSRSQIVTLKVRRGQNLKYSPFGFTEYGVAMLSSVLRSVRAVQVNIEIMRAFGRLRGALTAHTEFARRLDELEAKAISHDAQFQAVFDEIRRLLSQAPPEPSQKRYRIGFVTNPLDA